MSKEPEFGDFGEGVKPINHRRNRLKTSMIMFVVAMLFPAAYFGWNRTYTRFLEGDLPTITIPNPPEGVGVGSVSFNVEVGDASSGLDEVIIRAEQGGKQKELMKIRYDNEVKKRDTITVTLNGKEDNLRAGDLRIMVLAFDRSFWSNRKLANLYITVDYTEPRIEVITTQHNAVLGGSELVFYNVIDDEKNFSGLSGIKVGGWLFPGFQAKDLDPTFASHPQVYFTFFPVPLDFDRINHRYRLFVRDRVGNFSTAPLYYKVRDRRVRPRSIKLDPNFLQTKIPELYKDYLKTINQSDQYREAEGLSELLERFRIVNEEYRAVLEKSLAAFFSAPRKTRYWEDSFGRLNRSRQDGQFSELREFEFEGLEGGSHVNQGVDLIPPRGEVEVYGANAGIVVFADEFGLYGKTVIIDHGFGLTTMYAHLEKVTVEEGKRLATGDLIGFVGSTGLTPIRKLHFQVRLHGVPVRPVEWWEKAWVREHIEDKIKSVKRLLGIRVGRVLE